MVSCGLVVCVDSVFVILFFFFWRGGGYLVWRKGNCAYDYKKKKNELMKFVLNV